MFVFFFVGCFLADETFAPTSKLVGGDQHVTFALAHQTLAPTSKLVGGDQHVTFALAHQTLAPTSKLVGGGGAWYRHQRNGDCQASFSSARDALTSRRGSARDSDAHSTSLSDA